MDSDRRISGNEPQSIKLGRAWVFLAIAVAVHVTDETLTGFLSVYNPTVLALRARFAFVPLLTFSFGLWLSGLIAGIVLMLLVAPVVFRGSIWIRPVFYILAVIMVINALGHITGTILGHTVNSVRFPRPMPGFYSSPLLLAASLYALFRLRRASPRPIKQSGVSFQQNRIC
jgi:hypothetical protein